MFCTPALVTPNRPTPDGLTWTSEQQQLNVKIPLGYLFTPIRDGKWEVKGEAKEEDVFSGSTSGSTCLTTPSLVKRLVARSEYVIVREDDLLDVEERERRYDGLIKGAFSNLLLISKRDRPQGEGETCRELGTVLGMLYELYRED
jgi:hypothetical protein